MNKETLMFGFGTGLGALMADLTFDAFDVPHTLENHVLIILGSALGSALTLRAVGRI
jgi:hypothetical protein